ncbi:hypothetical protein LCGC14_2704910 [marine sediment metagenome]|uniref:Uncharacterized protein n=2 Tax=root TaxID=1 RepID=A0A7V1GDX9_9GAMM|nr:hypothetical protein [Pseudoalteromonas prydzensis]HEA15894.1 hypothetical protein [Pseudoalteromonas prydzensis]
MTNLLNKCQQIDVVRSELVRAFSFFIEEELFNEFTISEDLSHLGMGFKVTLNTEELIIGVFVSNIEKSVDCKISLRQSNMSVDWSLLRSDFDALRYLGSDVSDLLNNVNNSKKLIGKLRTKIYDEIQSKGIVNFLNELEQTIGEK